MNAELKLEAVINCGGTSESDSPASLPPCPGILQLNEGLFYLEG